jgi:excinuclease ABC subunit B
VEFFGDEIDSIHSLSVPDFRIGVSMPAAVVTPAKQFVTPKDKMEAAYARIQEEL